MYFNFELFSGLAERAYNQIPDHNYSLGEVIYIFKYYFQKYELERGQAHPNIRIYQIEKLITLMPYLISDVDSISRLHQIIGQVAPDIDSEDYPEIIDQHFLTRYRNCDYNINHFFSGKIREMRCHEIGL